MTAPRKFDPLPLSPVRKYGEIARRRANALQRLLALKTEGRPAGAVAEEALALARALVELDDAAARWLDAHPAEVAAAAAPTQPPPAPRIRRMSPVMVRAKADREAIDHLVDGAPDGAALCGAMPDGTYWVPLAPAPRLCARCEAAAKGAA